MLSNARMRTHKLVLPLNVASIYVLLLIQATSFVAQAISVISTNASHPSDVFQPPPKTISRTSTTTKTVVGAMQKEASKGEKNLSASVIPESKKFQPRMMRGAEAPLQESYYSDSWNPHSLVPTFTDQEQGDEMVALASDSEGRGVVVNKSLAELTGADGASSLYHQLDSRTARQQKQQQQQQQQQSEIKPAIVSKQQRPLMDEYYGDDEDEDDEMLPGKQALADLYDNESRKLHQSEGKQQFLRQQVVTQQQQQNNHNDESLSDDNERNQAESHHNHPAPGSQQPNKTSKLIQHLDSSWLSSSTRPSTDGYLQQQADNQHSLEQKVGGTRFSASRLPGGSEKLATLLAAGAGQRDTSSAFSKTGAAIEYLKNMLKSKQSQQNSNNNITDHQVLSGSVKQTIEQSIDKQANLNRLSSFATRLSQMLNSTNQYTSSISTSAAPERLTKSKLELESNMPNNNPSSISSKQQVLENSPQSDVKFSIVDAKAPASVLNLQELSSVTHQHSLPSETSFISSSSKQPSMESFYSSSHPLVSQVDPISSAMYAQDSALMFGSTPNGTPVGGDYIESLDDFPRDMKLHSIPSHDQAFFSGESHLLPIRHQDTKQDEQPLVASSSEQHRQEVVLKNVSPISNLGQLLKYHQDTYDSNLAPTFGTASSLRYFRMAQPLSSLKKDHNIQGTKTDTPKEEINKGSLSKSINQQQQQTIELPIPSFNQKLPEAPKLQKVIDSPKTITSSETAKIESNSGKFEEQQLSLKQPIPVQPQTLDIEEKQRQTPISTKSYNQKQRLQSSFSPEIPVAQDKPSQVQPQPIPHYTKHHFHTKDEIKPPNIVSYNYFESPSDSMDGEVFATNYQLGDALYSSTGGLEHMLSNSEIEAIQHQFINVDHPIVPIQNSALQNYDSQKPPKALAAPQQPPQTQEVSHFANLMAKLRPQSQQHPESVQRLNNNNDKTLEDSLKGFASNIEKVSVTPLDLTNLEMQQVDKQQTLVKETKTLESVQSDYDKKKKNLIVYLNHPRPNDISKVYGDTNLNQATDTHLETFISAKEFDIHGNSKDKKNLDISSLPEFENTKEGQDKDGLSVVVIGDAYKYKKIVLLISSKPGGLKFIPMVKEMKK